MASNTAKRPLPPSDSDEHDPKRVRSSNGSPATAPPANGLSDLERRKQDAAARVAAVKARIIASRLNGVPGAPPPLPATATATPGPPPTTPATDLEARKAAAQKKIAEMKAKVLAQQTGRAAPTVPPPRSESQLRVAEARARAAQMANQRTSTPAPPPPPRADASKTARGGLGIGLHPSLMGDLSAPTAGGKNRGRNGPKFSTTKGNEAPKVNPYLTAGDDDEKKVDDPSHDPAVPARKGGERKSRELVFNQKGKFMAQANALRQQARLEEMKKRIAAETRKTEIEEASDKAFLVPAPPEIEWWDEGLVNKIDTADTIITALIQHPVILKPPQDKFLPALKPLMLTPYEQKKLRRQRRREDMKEEQAKIRLGLVEPPAPKVKKSNMMRVLGEQAVKDPTAVEARVNKEIAQRATDHAHSNAERQLTKEQRAEKLKVQQLGDEAKGVRIAVFRVEDLSSGKHRYQVDVNAKQHALTGMVVLHPEMNLVIVEGGAHSLGAYRKLMLNRIKWGENTLPLSNTSGPSTFTGANDGTSKSTAANLSSSAGGGAKGGAVESNKAAQWLSPTDEHGGLKDLSGNACRLVWEGQEATRSFKKWGSRACETDGEARDVLGRSKMENMWTLARSLGGVE
ncbi:hypothetical protein LTR08_000643 [Meristemomyces frigidus]|nr:hypothetical protein LTR08_000643 [Meristemomyces frigidus]